MEEVKQQVEEEKITPSQYFDYIKEAKNVITTDALKNSYDTFIALAKKYQRLGQVESMKKLCFLADVLTKEEKLIEMGVNTFIYKDVIEDYIENVADKTVKIVELSRYMREVPDELVEVIERTKDFFDEFYVIFTDYTGKEERKVEKERRDKDPILFGVFKNSSNVADRFYFLGDWVDEYCDLTLDKLIEEYTDKKGKTPVIEENIPTTGEELVEALKNYQINEKKASNTLTVSPFNTVSVGQYEIAVSNDTTTKEEGEAKEKKSFFGKIRTVFKK